MGYHRGPADADHAVRTILQHGVLDGRHKRDPALDPLVESPKNELCSASGAVDAQGVHRVSEVALAVQAQCMRRVRRPILGS